MSIKYQDKQTEASSLTPCRNNPGSVVDSSRSRTCMALFATLQPIGPRLHASIFAFSSHTTDMINWSANQPSHLSSYQPRFAQTISVHYTAMHHHEAQNQNVNPAFSHLNHTCITRACRQRMHHLSIRWLSSQQPQQPPQQRRADHRTSKFAWIGEDRVRRTSSTSIGPAPRRGVIPSISSAAPSLELSPCQVHHFTCPQVT